MGDNAGANFCTQGCAGGLFGLTRQRLVIKQPNALAYQRGIPDYQFNRTLKEKAFSAVNPDGSTRRPGSMGRSYFDSGCSTPY